MTNTVFRTAIEPTQEKKAPVAQSEPVEQVLVSTPEHHDLFATYYDATGTPLTAEYMDMEKTWNQSPELKHEIESIEKYLQTQVSKGDIDNSNKAVKQAIKDMEKKAGVSPFESATKRITKLLAYIEFRKVVNG